jgi:hypothetical protein
MQTCVCVNGSTNHGAATERQQHQILPASHLPPSDTCRCRCRCHCRLCRCPLACRGAADVREAVIAVGLKPKEMTKQEKQQFNGRTRAYLQARCGTAHRRTLQAGISSCLGACSPPCATVLMFFLWCRAGTTFCCSGGRTAPALSACVLFLVGAAVAEPPPAADGNCVGLAARALLYECYGNWCLCAMQALCLTGYQRQVVLVTCW